MLPPLDIEETEDAYIVEVELPGLKKSDVDISLSGRRLTVSGERVEKERVGILRHRTRAVRKFQYEFLLPGDVDGKGVKASLDHGVLTVTVPKAQDDRPHRIEVTYRATDLAPTSAPINPGNSGGALVGLDASVIGIPTLAATVPELGGAAPGIGFAIPSNRAKFIADQLVATGTVTNSGRAALGISGATVASRSGEPLGVLVRAVQPGGAAEAAGIAPGDIVTAINEKPTPTLEALGTVLADLKPGDGATVTVLRPDATKRSVRLTLGNL